MDGEARHLGTVIVQFLRLPTANDLSMHTLLLAGRGLLLFLLGAGLLGALFGALTANGMTRRFARFSSAAESWSRGDFSQFIQDQGGDEISTLGDQLDSMAAQLGNLLHKRQEMAVMEERNRLARELHDSTKQQALAASFQLGTALTLYEQDPRAAKGHLQEAESLVDSVRVELTDLIHELRPSSMEGRDLAEALETYAIEWAHQSEVTLDLDLTPDQDLGLEARQTLYRVAQEALANVARHSGAEHVGITLEYSREQVQLCIQDDGCGFDTQAEYPGIGLETMQERCESLGGGLQIDSQPGEGTLICARLPIEPKEQER
jgi:NarL family two-component system sensor histidine kinase LiaS